MSRKIQTMTVDQLKALSKYKDQGYAVYIPTEEMRTNELSLIPGGEVLFLADHVRKVDIGYINIKSAEAYTHKSISKLAKQKSIGINTNKFINEAYVPTIGDKPGRVIYGGPNNF